MPGTYHATIIDETSFSTFGKVPMTPRQKTRHLVGCFIWTLIVFVTPLSAYLYLHQANFLFFLSIVGCALFAGQLNFYIRINSGEIGHLQKFGEEKEVLPPGMYWPFSPFPSLRRIDFPLWWSITPERVRDLGTVAGTTNIRIHKDDRIPSHNAHSKGSFGTIEIQRKILRATDWVFTLKDKEDRFMHDKLAWLMYGCCWFVVAIYSNFLHQRPATPQITPSIEETQQQPNKPSPQSQEEQKGHGVLLSSGRPIEVPPSEYFVSGAGPYSLYQIEYVLHEEGQLFVNSNMQGCKLVRPRETLEFVLNKPVRDAINFEKFVKTIIPRERDTYRPWKDLTSWQMADYRYKYVVRALDVNGQGGVICF